MCWPLHDAVDPIGIRLPGTEFRTVQLGQSLALDHSIQCLSG